MHIQDAISARTHTDSTYGLVNVLDGFGFSLLFDDHFWVSQSHSGLPILLAYAHFCVTSHTWMQRMTAKFKCVCVCTYCVACEKSTTMFRYKNQPIQEFSLYFSWHHLMTTTFSTGERTKKKQMRWMYDPKDIRDSFTDTKTKKNCAFFSVYTFFIGAVQRQQNVELFSNSIFQIWN